MIGGGFAGCVLGLVADRIGLDVVVVEKDAHPRFAIGESTTPIANMVLRDLADRYDLAWLDPLSSYGPWRESYPEVGVGRKRGFSYFYHRPGQPFKPQDDHRGELLVTANESDEEADTHWLRADVDAFLASRVRGAGIPLLEQTRIESVRGEGPWTLLGQGPDGPLEIGAEWVVEATGGRGPLQRSLGIPDETDRLRTRSRALFGHFRGVHRWEEILAERGGSIEDHPFRCDEAALHHVVPEGWMWAFRFADGRVSAGFVSPESEEETADRPAPRRQWGRLLARYPSIHAQLGEATLADPPGRLIRSGPLQYRAGRIAGPGWALLPGAAGFSGPLHSTGIAHALIGVERLGRVFERCYTGVGERATEHSAGSLATAYERSVRCELELIDRLLALAHRSLGCFRLFRSACLYYFAAATTYERRRAHGHLDPAAVFEKGPRSAAFLCAGEPELQTALEEAGDRLPTGRPGSDRAIAAFEAFTEEALGPYDEVGLFDPPVPNMYPHTAPP